MLKSLFISIFILCSSLYINAQVSKEDIIYLKNGSILRGKISDTSQNIKIKIIGNNEIVIPKNEIANTQYNQTPSYRNKKIELYSLISLFGENAGFNFITTLPLPYRLSLGLGTGVEWFDNAQIPMFIDFRYHMLSSHISPFIYGNLGYALPMERKAKNENFEYKGGILAAAGGGVRFNFTKNNALFFGIGYRYQKSKAVQEINNYYPGYNSHNPATITNHDEFNRFTFSFGFIYN